MNQLYAERGVLSEEHRESLGRYQVALDNQLSRMLKELREAQKWRLRAVEGEVVGQG